MLMVYLPFPSNMKRMHFLVHRYLNNAVCLSIFQQFEEDALSWEDKLNRINALFDVWIDVQRRWVYLEGIFTGSADIQHLLPVETQRFQG